MKLHRLWDATLNKGTNFSGWFFRFRWWMIGTIGAVLVALEIIELFLFGVNLGDVIEIVLYLSMTMIIGILIELLLRSLAKQMYIAKILDAKNKLTIKLMAHESWDVMAVQLARFPSEIAPIQNARLYLRNSISNRFELAAAWNKENGSSGKEHELHAFQACQSCRIRQTRDEFLTKTCLEEASSRQYCFQINEDDRLIANLQFSLEPDAQLTKDQKDILWNVRLEMAVALQAGLDRKRFTELQLAQAALSERRMVTHYLHDNLSQNLGYIRLKLDQLVNGEENIPKDVRCELERILNAAEQSFELVRGKLELLHPETTPVITNLLIEHAHKVSEQAKIKVNFKTHGKAVILSPDVQRAVFYAFKEALGNIEKHAGACEVEVLIIWSAGNLNIIIKDNGRGFDPAQVQADKHFGLQIMLDRITSVSGWIEFNSSINTGTTVSISVPLALVDAEKEVAV